MEFAAGCAPAAAVNSLEQHLAGCRECMELVAQLPPDSLVQKIRLAEESAAQADQGKNPVTPTPLRLVAGYEIREEIGRGGMGIVYRAWQPGLGRMVALKRLKNADAAGRKALERFRNEATVLARLNHPCIVGVYDVGEQDGQPFIAMELVDGVTLAERLRDKLPDSRTAAQTLVQLADAVAAANEQGIIHRDLKPQNVLIAESWPRCPDTAGSEARASQAWKPDNGSGNLSERAEVPASGIFERGQNGQDMLLVPKLVDFGLSRLQGEGKSITESAELLGTPGYMAPEQLCPGAATTQAADIYGLGAILYQCLTGRAPFQGATAVETIAMVLSSDVLPIRKLRRDVPRDLQVICHRCLEKEPKHRYASAAALGDDLRCFLEARPIQARPPGSVRKLVLWTRRNKAIAMLSATILAAIVLGGVAITAYQVRLKTDRDHASRRYANARETIWRMIDSAGAQSIFEVPKLQELLASQARESMALFEQFASEEQSEQAIIDLARLRMLLGTISIAQGNPEEGEVLLRQSAEAIADLPIRERGTAELMKLAISAQVKLATSLFGQGKTGVALDVLAPAQRFAEVLVRQDPDSPGNLNELAWVHHVSGSARFGAGEFGVALEDFQLAVTLRKRAFAMDPRNVELANFLAGSLVNLALCDSSLGNNEQSLVGFREAIDLLKTVQPMDPRSSGIAIVLAGARLNASNILAAGGNGGGAIDLLTEGILELQPFLDAAPDDFQLRENMFKLVGNRALHGNANTPPEQVIADWNRAIELANRDEDRQFCQDQLQALKPPTPVQANAANR